MKSVLITALATLMVFTNTAPLFASHTPTYPLTFAGQSWDLDNDNNGVDIDADDQNIHYNICFGNVTELNGDEFVHSNSIWEDACEDDYGHPVFSDQDSYRNSISSYSQGLGNGHVLTWVGNYTTFNDPSDLCTNLPGQQLVIPEGYEDPESDGICTEIDLCTNIAGIQWPNYPNGYEDLEPNGTCTPVPLTTAELYNAVDYGIVRVVASGVTLMVVYSVLRMFVWKPQ
jgi:hypothetical protein